MNLYIRLMILGLISLSTAVSHSSGPSNGGGGDRCERRFKEVARDIADWIKGDGPRLRGLDVTQAKISIQEYSQGMLEQLSQAQVTCVGPGDVGYPVLVHGRPKECRNYFDADGQPRIICDIAKFYSNLRDPETNPEQYMMVHHEYATLAGFELPMAANSIYPLSDQITGFLEDRRVKKLAIKPARAEVPFSQQCYIRGYGQGYTAVYIGDARATSVSSKPEQAIQDLKSLVDAGACKLRVYTCELRGGNGYMSVSINNEWATQTTSNVEEAIEELNRFVKAGVCEQQVPGCNIRTNTRGYTAVFIREMRVTSYTDEAIETIKRIQALTRAGICRQTQAESAPY